MYVAAGREMDVRERSRRQLGEFLGQLDGGTRGVAEQVEERELLELRANGVRDLFPAEADDARFERSDAVQVLAALRVPDAAAGATDEDARASLRGEIVPLCVRHPEV